MEGQLSASLVSGIVSLVIAEIATFGASLVVPTGDLAWALIAVAFASFFSGFFSSYFTR